MEHAATLRALHVPGSPLLLPNAWDAASAKLVEAAGFPVVATSSAAVARSLGSDDHEAMDAGDALAASARIVEVVEVPVTVDFESGYGLDPEAIASGLLATGACGCNLEDSDHRNPGTLVDAETQAQRIAAVRAAAGDRLDPLSRLTECRPTRRARRRARLGRQRTLRDHDLAGKCGVDLPARR